MAEAWGTPPWEIMDTPGGVVWMARFVAYHKILDELRDKPPPSKR